MLEQILLIFVGYIVASMFLRVIYTPFNLLVPVIFVMCFVGAFSVRNIIFDAALLIIFGLFGWLMKREGYPVIAVIIGVMLGGTADSELVRTFQLYQGNFSKLTSSPICLTLIFLTILSLVSPYISKITGFLKKK